MADVTVSGPSVGAHQDSTEVACASMSFTGAASTWAAQHSLGGSASDDLLFKVPIRRVRVGTAGSGALHVMYVTGVIDTIPALLEGHLIDGKILRIYGDSTVEDVTVFW